MSRVRYIIASLVLLTSGIYCTGVICDLGHAESTEEFLPNTQYTLEKTTNNLYLQKLAEMSAYEAFGQPVKVVIE